MKKIISVFCLVFLSILSQANPSAPVTPSVTDVNKDREIMVAPVGFDKVLSLILVDINDPVVDIALSQKKQGIVFKTSLRTSEVEILEVDLADFDRGTYELTVYAGNYQQHYTIVLP